MMGKLAWFTLGTLKGWRRIGYKVNIWQNLVNDLIVILYWLQSPITAARQKVPTYTHSSVPSLLHGGTHLTCVCVCACMYAQTLICLSLGQSKCSRNPAQQLFLQISLVCPQGNFSQFNCLGGLFPCGILFQNIPVKISF